MPSGGRARARVALRKDRRWPSLDGSREKKGLKKKKRKKMQKIKNIL